MKKICTSLIITLLLIIVIKSSEAHQPVLNSEISNSEEPYIIEEPEISKAIFAELKGEPHYYRIDSNTKFKFYAGITTPKIDNCPLTKKVSFDVLNSNFELIKKKDGEKFNWWAWYEKHGEKWYWIGPEIGEKFKSNRDYNKGTYYIRVFNQNNTGQYVLAVGDIESFPISVIIKMLFTLPSINSAFWDDVSCPETKIHNQ